jgi:Ribonuclease G/E
MNMSSYKLFRGGYGIHMFYTVAENEEKAVESIQEKHNIKHLPVIAEEIDDVDGFKIIPATEYTGASEEEIERIRTEAAAEYEQKLNELQGEMDKNLNQLQEEKDNCLQRIQELEDKLKDSSPDLEKKSSVKPLTAKAGEKNGDSKDS